MRTELLLALLVVRATSAEDPDSLEDSFVTEYRGYFKREHSLLKPYQGAFLSPLLPLPSLRHGRALLGHPGLDDGHQPADPTHARPARSTGRHLEPSGGSHLPGSMFSRCTAATGRCR